MKSENISNFSDLDERRNYIEARVSENINALRINHLEVTRNEYRTDPQDITRLIILNYKNIQAVRSDLRLLAIYSEKLLKLAYYSYLQRKYKLALRYIRVRNIFSIKDRMGNLLKALVFLRSGHVIKYYMVATEDIRNNLMIKKITCSIPFQITKIYTYKILKENIFSDNPYALDKEIMVGILRMAVVQNYCTDRILHIYPFKSCYIINCREELRMRVDLIIKYYKADMLKLNCHLILFADLLDGIDHFLFMKILHLRVLFPENILILRTHNLTNNICCKNLSEKMTRDIYEYNKQLIKSYQFSVIIGDRIYVGSTIPERAIALDEIDEQERGKNIIDFEKIFSEATFHPTYEQKAVRRFSLKNGFEAVILQRKEKKMKLFFNTGMPIEPSNIIEIRPDVFLNNEKSLNSCFVFDRSV